MIPPADATCPRCGAAFHCGVHDATPCACGSIDLRVETLHALRERYTACLCLACLCELAELPEDTLHAGMKKPAQP